jgi:site-specific DNA-methyltransferase (adenine-specific)
VPKPKTVAVRKDRKPKPLYRQKTPKIQGDDFVHAEPITPAHFELREDGSIKVIPSRSDADGGRPQGPPVLTFRDDTRNLWLYQGNSLELLDAIAAKHPEGRFDCIFADPPYFLSNGGISCHAGKMVKVDKGDWDKSRGAEVNHEFNLEWLKRCQKVLKPNGTIWITGTHHVIFSIGYALQQLGFKILNDIAWEKPNPPPNLSCRYFTHSTETILWAAKTEKSKHLFNYQEMRKVTGKQMKTVWRREEFEPRINTDKHGLKPGQSDAEKEIRVHPCPSVVDELENIWTMTAPGGDEKTFGKHPTQKPVSLVERCIAASTNPGDMVLDPFLGGGTTAVACARLNRGCVGIEMDEAHAKLSKKRLENMISIISEGGGH